MPGLVSVSVTRITLRDRFRNVFEPLPTFGTFIGHGRPIEIIIERIVSLGGSAKKERRVRVRHRAR